MRGDAFSVADALTLTLSGAEHAYVSEPGTRSAKRSVRDGPVGTR